MIVHNLKYFYIYLQKMLILFILFFKILFNLIKFLILQYIFYLIFKIPKSDKKVKY